MSADWANPQIEALLNEMALAVNPSLVSVHSHDDHHHSHDHDHGHDHHHHH